MRAGRERQGVQSPCQRLMVGQQVAGSGLVRLRAQKTGQTIRFGVPRSADCHVCVK